MRRLPIRSSLPVLHKNVSTPTAYKSKMFGIVLEHPSGYKAVDEDCNEYKHRDLVDAVCEKACVRDDRRGEMHQSINHQLILYCCQSYISIHTRSDAASDKRRTKQSGNTSNDRQNIMSENKLLHFELCICIRCRFPANFQNFQ